MASVYVVKDDGNSVPMESFHCKDETKELHDILRKNFKLLAGDQIEPLDERQWLLVKWEMPVPDPTTGSSRWSIDFLFLDQDATPTFVECKRFLDTRSRREVVGQALEYAANAQHYWSSDDLRQHAEQTATNEGKTLDENFQALHSGLFESPEEFFKEAERKLKSSDIRLLFFLEDAPAELKRLVEYMNAQMATVEVLLVEARQFRCDGLRVVVPMLYGYTEQIREIKRAASSGRTRTPIATDWESFTKNAVQKGVDEKTIVAMRQVYEACKVLQADITWGKGVSTGSFIPKWPTLSTSASPFSIYADGKLEFHARVFQSTDSAKAFSRHFADVLRESGFPVPANYDTAWARMEADAWVPHVNAFIATLKPVFEKYVTAPLPRAQGHV